MADYARLARDAGAKIIGGCCGTSCGHLAAMRQALDDYTPGPRRRSRSSSTGSARCATRPQTKAVRRKAAVVPAVAATEASYCH